MDACRHRGWPELDHGTVLQNGVDKKKTTGEKEATGMVGGQIRNAEAQCRARKVRGGSEQGRGMQGMGALGRRNKGDMSSSLN